MECDRVGSNKSDETDILEVLLCSICRKKFLCMEEIVYHMKSHQTEIRVQDRSSKRISRNFAITAVDTTEKKQARQYSSRTYKCASCNYKTNYLTTYKRHKQLHEKKQNGNQCPFCSYITVQPYNLQRHIKNLHPNGKVETATYIRSIGGIVLPKPIPITCDIDC